MKYQYCNFAKGLNRMKKIFASLAITALVALPLSAQEQSSTSSASGGAVEVPVALPVQQEQALELVLQLVQRSVVLRQQQ